MSLLKRFGKLSGLIVNHDKSEALNVNLTTSTLQSIQSQYPFHWQSTSLSYLGIRLTPSISSLYKANYPTLFAKLLEDVKTWSDINLPWMGRIASVKMTVLPRFLYCFRTLPIQVPAHAIQHFHSQIRHYIWGT